jgi:hypothetical protein
VGTIGWVLVAALIGVNTAFVLVGRSDGGATLVAPLGDAWFWLHFGLGLAVLVIVSSVTRWRGRLSDR